MIEGTGWLKGFVITFRNMLRGPITIRYPEHKLTLPERSRWAVHQRLNDDGSPRCTACLICVKECPDDVLYIETSAGESGGKHIDRYVYEIGACMMCGLCVEACPFSAIEMSHEYELATRHGGDLVRVLLQDVDAASPRREKKGEADA